MWTNKHMPRTLDDICITSVQRECIKNNIRQHYLITGPCGSGKSTLANIIANKSISFTINLFEEHDTTIVSKHITNICKYYVDAEYKYIIIDMVETLSTNIQEQLSHLMAKKYNAYFILTCNNMYMLDDSIRSHTMNITLGEECIRPYIQTILDKENVSLSNDVLDDIVSKCKSDIRHACILAQLHDNEFISTTDIDINAIGNQLCDDILSSNMESAQLTITDISKRYPLFDMLKILFNILMSRKEYKLINDLVYCIPDNVSLLQFRTCVINYMKNR